MRNQVIQSLTYDYQPTLQWLARHVDQAENIKIWLADTGVKSESAFKAAMDRVINVAQPNGMLSTIA